MKDLNQILHAVQSELQQVEQKMKAPMEGQNPLLSQVVERLVDSGGKRLRPAISLLATHLGTAKPDEAIALAASVEMLHTATLIHDDLLDKADERRGTPTIHTEWDMGATVLAGDYLFARSAALVTETNNVKVIRIFSETLMTIVNGELNQFFSRNIAKLPTRDDYFKRIYGKTASLFAASAQSGGILVNLPPDQVNALREYGYHLGMAFQIIDDIFDFKSEPNDIGKPVANDLKQGIATLPVLLFLDSFPDHTLILKAITEKGINDSEVEQIVTDIRQSGILKTSFAEAQRFITQAQFALSTLPDMPARQSLYELAEYAIARQI